jgi:DNA-binding MarR family transcriptional regulator
MSSPPPHRDTSAESTVDRTLYLIHRTRVATADAVADVLSDLQLNGTLALILESLYELGAAPAAQIARRCLVTRQALTAPLNDLQRRGLVQRPESAANVRVRPTELTESGREVALEVRARIRQLERAAMAEFDPAEVHALRVMLGRYAVAWERLAGVPSEARAEVAS